MTNFSGAKLDREGEQLNVSQPSMRVALARANPSPLAIRDPAATPARLAVPLGMLRAAAKAAWKPPSGAPRREPPAAAAAPTVICQIGAGAAADCTARMPW